MLNECCPKINHVKQKNDLNPCCSWLFIAPPFPCRVYLNETSQFWTSSGCCFGPLERGICWLSRVFLGSGIVHGITAGTEKNTIKTRKISPQRVGEREKTSWEGSGLVSEWHSPSAPKGWEDYVFWCQVRILGYFGTDHFQLRKTGTISPCQIEKKHISATLHGEGGNILYDFIWFYVTSNKQQQISKLGNHIWDGRVLVTTVKSWILSNARAINDWGWWVKLMAFMNKYSCSILCLSCSIWVFPKIGVPQNGWFKWKPY